MNIIGFIKGELKRIMGTNMFAWGVLVVDGLTVLPTRVGRRREEKEFQTCVVAAPGNGNIGDQALLETCLDRAGEGKVAVVMGRHDSLAIPDRYMPNVSVFENRDLIYSLGWRRLIAIGGFARVSVRSDRVWVIGADTMDGAYNRLASISRFSLARIASVLGADSRILGFSWNGAAVDSSVLAARRVEKRVQLWVRDPISLARIRADGIERAQLCADIVFARTSPAQVDSSIKEWMDSQVKDGRRIAVVNASGLIAEQFDQVGEYKKVLDYLLRSGWSVVLLPHVSRPGNDDIEELTRLCSKVSSDRIIKVDRLLEPDQVLGVVRDASVVVTGRMHLAVLSILGGTYPITIATQGKVEGLYQSLRLPELCIEPEGGCGGRIVEVLLELDRNSLLSGMIPWNDVEELRSRAELAFA